VELFSSAGTRLQLKGPFFQVQTQGGAVTDVAPIPPGSPGRDPRSIADSMTNSLRNNQRTNSYDILVFDTMGLDAEEIRAVLDRVAQANGGSLPTRLRILFSH